MEEFMKWQDQLNLCFLMRAVEFTEGPIQFSYQKQNQEHGLKIPSFGLINPFS